jgi:hypothetical protein
MGILVPHHRFGNCPTLIFYTNSTAGQSGKQNFIKMKKKNLLLTAVATLGLAAATIAQNVPSYVPTNGLVGWWPFNGNANDESGNGNNGTVNGATLTADRFGNSNKAYSFDGVDDFIQLQTPSFNNAITISFWVYDDGGYPNAYSINPRYVSAEFCNGSFALVNNVINSSNGLFFSRNRGSSSADIFSTVPPTYKVNQHIVFTYDGTMGAFYINGFLVSSINNSGNITKSSNLFFGKSGCNNAGQMIDAFKGKLDEIGFWNRALTQQEITDLYNGNICYQTITVTDTLLINMGITGFNPVTYNNTIKIYPNPTNDHLTIDYGNFASLSGYQLKIENSLGQQVFQTNITQKSNYLSLSNWGGNGLYFVHIIDPQGNTVDIKKIVLQ